MAGLAPSLEKEEFRNWVKGALALLFTKEGLKDFVSTLVVRHHQRLLQQVPPAYIHKTCTCTIKSLPECTKSNKHGHVVANPRQSCARGVCNFLMDCICKDHRFRGPSWKNTDPQKWCTDAFEIAKCFMAREGYSQKSSLNEVDFNGILSVVINNLSAQVQDINICTKAREVGNAIRHSANQLLSDSDLKDYIDNLINLLCAPVCLVNDPSVSLVSDMAAQEAVRKLRMLKTNTLTIRDKDITDALTDDIREKLSDEHRDLLQKISDHYTKLQTDSVAEIDRIIAVRKTELEEHANKLMDDMTRHAETKKDEIEAKQLKGAEKEKSEFWFWDILTFKEYRLRSKIKEDLITYYRENESQIPAAPLVEEHKVALEDLYVTPPMWAYNNPYHFGPGNAALTGHRTSNNDATKRQRATFSHLFRSGDNVRYKKIYITANAGCGKTSLSQRLTMTWCQAHSPRKALKNKYEGAELAALKYFDLLFLLHLRDYQSEPKCNLDDLIIQMVTENLPRNTLYTKEFLQRVLHERKCLIIVDGLDEWDHPDKCGKTPAVPHNNYPDSCTVLTTSRPWKLGTIGLSEHNIDRHIEISQLDVKTRKQLENKAVQILNEKGLNLAGKDRADFDKEVKSVLIGEIIYIPYILLQLMCLFFGDLPIGKSKCEIYSNITELTLKLGLIKKNVSGINVQSNDNPPVPICMKENETCKLYISLIKKLGKLACFTLFGEKKETSLIFDSKVVTQYLTEQEIEFCLNVGLLCQTKDNSILAERRYKVFFHHKSVQEFFSAIYITSKWENNTVQSTIFNACSSFKNTLEMSNLFVFVCGMNHEVYTCISGELQKIVERDQVTCRYRRDLYTPWEYSVYEDDWRTMKSYQSMQVQCFQESVRNRNESCSIHLYDIVLHDSLTEDDLTDLNTIILLYNDDVKSLQLESPDEKIDSFVKSLDPGVFNILEILRVEWCDKEPVWLANILTEYSRTLKCLKLSGTQKELLSLSDISITALTGLTCLQSLYLRGVNMTHSNLKRLYAYISQTTTLTQLTLYCIYCSDHKDQDHRDCDVTLDLHLLNELRRLHLYAVPCRELHVKHTCIEKFEFVPWQKMTDSASGSLLEDLRTAPVLTTLGLGNMPSSQMIQINHTLTQLQHQLQNLKLTDIDMCDVIPRLTPAMTNLERVDLWWVKLSSAAWREVFHSVGQLPQSITVKLVCITMTSREWIEMLLSVGGMPQVVTVELQWCKGPSRTQWADIVDVIKSTATLSLLQDLSINDDGEASLSLEKQ